MKFPTPSFSQSSIFKCQRTRTNKMCYWQPKIKVGKEIWPYIYIYKRVFTSKLFCCRCLKTMLRKSSRIPCITLCLMFNMFAESRSEACAADTFTVAPSSSLLEAHVTHISHSKLLLKVHFTAKYVHTASSASHYVTIPKHLYIYIYIGLLKVQNIYRFIESSTYIYRFIESSTYIYIYIGLLKVQHLYIGLIKVQHLYIGLLKVQHIYIYIYRLTESSTYIYIYIYIG